MIIIKGNISVTRALFTHTECYPYENTKLANFANFVCFEKTRIIQLSSFGITHNKHCDKVVQFRVNTDIIHFVHGRLSPFDVTMVNFGIITHIYTPRNVHIF